MRHLIRCPSPELLGALFDSARPPANSLGLLRHLEWCGDCRAGLSALSLAVTVHPAFDPDEDSKTCSLGPGSEWQGTDVIVTADRRPDAVGPPPPPPRRFGRYEVVGVIGRGGMGVVVKALDPSHDRFVAVKAIAPGYGLSPQSQLRLAREAQLASQVHSEYVVPVYEMGEENGAPYLVMPYVRGKDLGHRLRRSRRLPLAEAVRIGREVAAGLAAAHALGIVHRDIKPGNIILESPEGAPPGLPPEGAWARVRVTDFGVARMIGGEGITRTGERMGTPEYMAPEQATGVPIDHRCDLYALGLLLFRMIVGRSPFDARNAIGFIEHHVRTPPPRPSEFVPGGVPDWLDGLILQLLQKDPADRVQTAAEVLRRLDEGLPTGGGPVYTPPGWAD